MIVFALIFMWKVRDMKQKYGVFKGEKEWTTFYKMIDIKKPSEITIERLAKIFNIEILYKPLFSRYDMYKNNKFILLDSRLDIKTRKEHFFFMLFMLYYNETDDDKSEETIRRKASEFVEYATIPYYLLKKYNLNDKYIVDVISDDFNITSKLCQRRLNDIKHN